MYNLSKKQKAILIALAIIIMLAIFYYVYAKDETSENINFNENSEKIEIGEEETQEQAEEESNSTIIVHVTGAVNNQGVVELQNNSRIADAIDKAGGLKEDANISKINLAYILEDGIKIYIPSINDKEEDKANEDNTEQYVEKDNSINVDDKYNSINKSNIENISKSKTSKININIATQTNLEELPGIGPSTALKIIQYRNENGKFKTIEEIKEISGIGESKYEKIKELISIK